MTSTFVLTVVAMVYIAVLTLFFLPRRDARRHGGPEVTNSDGSARDEAPDA